MSRQGPRLAALVGESVPPPAPPPPVPESVDPDALRYRPCEGGCDTLLACSRYAGGPIEPPFRCVCCAAGKTAWEKDPPYIPPAGPAPEEEEVEQPE